MADLPSINKSGTQQIVDKLKNPNLIVDPQSPVEWEKYDVLNQSISRYFALDPYTVNKFQDKIDMIKDWAKSKAHSDDRLDILWALRSLENRLGTPPAGEKRINHIYRWVKLETIREKIEREQKSLEGSLGGESGGNSFG